MVNSPVEYQGALTIVDMQVKIISVAEWHMVYHIATLIATLL